MDRIKSDFYRKKLFDGNLFDKAVQCLATDRPGLVGNILLEENKKLQIDEIEDIEKLMPDMKVETLEPVIKGQ